MKRSTKSLEFLFIIIMLASFGPITTFFSTKDVSATSYRKYQRVEFTFNPTIRIDLSGGDITIANLTPGTGDDSNIIDVDVITNTLYGFRLSASVGDSIRQYQELKNTSTTPNSIFSPLESAKTDTGSNFGDNKWGYAYAVKDTTNNTYGTWSNYNGLPLYNDPNHVAELLSITKTVATAETSSGSVGFKIGARASTAQTTGEYTNVINFKAVTNIVTTNYTLSYIDNSGQAQDIPASITTPVTITNDTQIALSPAVPTRNDHAFIGWCTTSTNDDTCSGQVYSPSDTYAVGNVGGTIAINLYAMWRNDDPCSEVNNFLYCKVADQVKKSNGTPLTQTKQDLKVQLTKPTSNDPATDTSNSGVYLYNADAFGTASDAFDAYNIYYYRGILDNSFASSNDNGNIGSSGDGTLYPNYVILDANGTKETSDTCWRIIRTTGSGGTKMIYNGLWTGSTCANASSDAQTTTQAYGRKGNSSKSDWYKNINRVGYTFNNDTSIQDFEADTLVGIVFGDNNSIYLNNARSNIKIYLEDTWYPTISTYTSVLEASAGYCNDRSTYADSSAETPLSVVWPYKTSDAYVGFGAGLRNTSTSAPPPSLTCTRGAVDLYRYVANSDGLSNELKYPVALLTADESSFAGSGFIASTGSVSNVESYLNSSYNFWLLSPYSRLSNGGVSQLRLSGSGQLVDYSVNGTHGVRPVVSLKHTVNITSGAGTAANPWVVTAPSN